MGARPRNRPTRTTTSSNPAGRQESCSALSACGHRQISGTSHSQLWRFIVSPQPIFGGIMRDRYQRGRVEERGSRRKSGTDTISSTSWRKASRFASTAASRWVPSLNSASGRREEKLRAIIERETGTVNPIKEAVTFGWFYDNRFEPMRKGRLCLEGHRDSSPAATAVAAGPGSRRSLSCRSCDSRR